MYDVQFGILDYTTTHLPRHVKTEVVTARTPERSRTPTRNIGRCQRECTGVGKPDSDSEQRLRSNGMHPVTAANLVLPWPGLRALVGAQVPPEIIPDETADSTLGLDQGSIDRLTDDGMSFSFVIRHFQQT